jgi:hypothetical protein
MKKHYHCGCGEITGVRCDWYGPASGMVVVDYMPEYLRSTHESGGNSGVWPLNGALRLALSHGCAESVLACHPAGWWAERPEIPAASIADTAV